MEVQLKKRLVLKSDKSHLKISCNVEGHSSGGVNDIKNGEVEAKGWHSRPKNYDKGREKWGTCIKPCHNPWPF